MAGKRGLFAILVPVVLLSVGCFGPSDEAKARLAETKASGDALIAKFEGLEDRFLGNQANIKLYDELRERHQSVSAIACANQNEHFAEMVSHLEKTTEKARKLRRSRNVASAKVTLSSATMRTSHKSKKAHD